MAMKTRDRIILEARRLFNSQGFGNVTTASLAAHLGMAEGNLWYHFKSKRSLLDAISEEFVTAIEQRIAISPAPDADILDEYGRLLEHYLPELSEYRFLYRDQSDYGEHNEIILERLPGWYEATIAQFETFFTAMCDVGFLDWPKDHLRELAINVAIILRYNLEFMRETGQPALTGSGAIHRTFTRHLTLFERHLKPEAARHLHRTIDAIDARLRGDARLLALQKLV